MAGELATKTAQLLKEVDDALEQLNRTGRELLMLVEEAERQLKERDVDHGRK